MAWTSWTCGLPNIDECCVTSAMLQRRAACQLLAVRESHVATDGVDLYELKRSSVCCPYTWHCKQAESGSWHARTVVKISLLFRINLKTCAAKPWHCQWQEKSRHRCLAIQRPIFFVDT